MYWIEYLTLILSAILDFLLLFIVADTFMLPKFTKLKSYILFGLTIVLLVIINIFLNASYLVDILTVFIFTIYLFYYFKGSILYKIKLLILTILAINVIMSIVNFSLEFFMKWSYIVLSNNIIYIYLQKFIDYIVVIVVLNLILSRLKNRCLNNKNYIFTVLILMFLNITVLLSTFDFYAKADYSKESFETLILIIIIANFLVIMITLLLFNRLQAQLLKMHETEINALNSERMSEYYRNLAGNTEEIRKFRHDMRYHAQVIDTYLTQGQTMKARDYLQTNIGHLSYRNIIYIEGLPVVSAILSDIQAKCKLLNYKFEPEVYVNYIPMEDDDISVIIGNILTNALEALKKDSTDDRFILFEIKATAEVTIISCRNHYIGKLLPKGNLYRTTKPNASNHGYGLNTIQERVSKYDGVMEIIPKNQVFHIQIFLKNNDPPSTAKP